MVCPPCCQGNLPEPQRVLFNEKQKIPLMADLDGIYFFSEYQESALAFMDPTRLVTNLIGSIKSKAQCMY